MKNLALLAISVVLIGCGGGGSDTPSLPTPPVECTGEVQAEIHHISTPADTVVTLVVNECNDLIRYHTNPATGHLWKFASVQGDITVAEATYSAENKLEGIKYSLASIPIIEYRWSENAQCFYSEPSGYVCEGDPNWDQLARDTNLDVWLDKVNELEGYF